MAGSPRERGPGGRPPFPDGGPRSSLEAPWLQGQLGPLCGFWLEVFIHSQRGPSYVLIFICKIFYFFPQVFSVALATFFLYLLTMVGGEEFPLETSLVQGSPGTREQERQRPALLGRTEGPEEDLGEEQGPQGPLKLRSWSQGLGNPGRRPLYPPESCPTPRQAAPLGRWDLPRPH